MYKKYPQITNSSRHLIFLYMSLFDSEKNIQTIPLHLLLQRLPKDSEFVFGQHYLWFKSDVDNPELHRTNFNRILELTGDGIKMIVSEFNEDYNNIQIDTNSQKTIPEQICEFMKSYLTSDIPIDITVDKYFIALNNHINISFKTAAEGWEIRNKIGQRGFDIPSQDIGYLHVMFDVTKLNLYKTKSIIHWFYPLAVVRNE